MEGEVLLNGHPKVQQTFTRVMGYVEQNDIHTPQVTLWPIVEVKVVCVC